MTHPVRYIEPGGMGNIMNASDLFIKALENEGVEVIDSVNKYSILLNSVLYCRYEYYRCSHTQSTDTV